MTTIPRLSSLPLGQDGPELPRLGLGFVGLSGAYGFPEPDEERLAFLSQAYDRGEVFWDCADEYSDCEELIGKWLAANPEKREKVFIATKFGIKRGEGEVRTSISFDSSPKYCREAIEKSLKRLGIPCVDLYYVHRLDEVTPIEKTMQALVDLKEAGKIKHIGLSEMSAESLRRAHKVHPIACVQVEYNPFCLKIESPEMPVLETAHELGVAVVAYCPLGHGFITGTLRKKEDFSKPGDLRGMIPWLREENLDKNVAIVDKLSQIARAKGVTTTQLTLAWVLAQGVFAIPGTTKIRHLEENLASLDIMITPEEDAAVREAAKEVIGGRVQDLMGHSFADTPALT